MPGNGMLHCRAFFAEKNVKILEKRMVALVNFLLT